jgi:hypothetical protein
VLFSLSGPIRRQKVTLSIGLNWAGSTWRQEQNPVSETLWFKRKREWWIMYRIVEVEVTLRPTVRWPVRLGVLPLLGQMTRCNIYMSDNYFLYFSCRAPSLTRGRVCNVQCNNASSISSYIATYGLSASSSRCRAPIGAHNQILISLFDSYFVFSV